MRRLREWRGKRFLTQKQLAELMGVPYQTIQRWESGGRFPRPRLLQKLCEVLAVSPEQLVDPEEWQAKRVA